MSLIRTERDGDVVTLTFNDPDRRNAMTQAMGEAFAAAIARLAEDANIIFGAVIDEETPEGEARVTVTATGLDDGRAWRGRDHERSSEASANVMPLRREEGLSDPAPVAHERPSASAGPAPAASQSDAAHQDDWLSPFEDELDVPTFLRRGGRDPDAEDEQEVPAFLRRSAD